ncbi:glycosyltransferase family 2 protein [Bacteroides thetaiotaomicron]|nr:glycosyltransferase family 2 protein [Bacteroides thetaiotaomicron]
MLEQDYPCLEMYVIDDGSVDNTKEVIKNYITKFDKRGYTLTYIFQENEGQSVAVNRALKSIKVNILCGLIVMIFMLIPLLYLKWFQY